MEQGFLNKSNKNSMMNAGNISSVLSSMAKRGKNFDGKLLGKDGKPFMPYRYVMDNVVSTNVADDAVGIMGNIMNDGALGNSPTAVMDTVGNLGAAGNTSTLRDTPDCEGSKVMGDVDLSLADVVLPQAVELISARLDNSLYGFFVGKRPAFLVVKNFARNVWSKHGITHVMIHQGFFIFQFSTKEGMEHVLNQGNWRIRSVPLILNFWNPSSELKKEEIKMVPVWVKLFNVPIVAYSKVGLDMIASKLGRFIMLDEHTCNMCLNSWGMNSYARMLVEISAESDFVESLVVAVPIAKTKEHRLVTIDIEFEYKLHRCSVCKNFDHVETECHKKVKEVNRQMRVDAGFVSDKRKPKAVNKVKVTGKPKMIYRPVAKPSINNHASTSIPKVNSINQVINEVTNEDNAKVQSDSVPPLVSSNDLSQPGNEYDYFKDNINIDDLKHTMENIQEEDKVLDLASNSSNVVDVGKGSEVQINIAMASDLSTLSLEGGMDKEKSCEVSTSTVSLMASDLSTLSLEGGMDKEKSCEVSTSTVSLVEPLVSVLIGKEVGNLSLPTSTSANKRANPFSKVGNIVDSDSEEEVLNTFDESANLFDMPMGTYSSIGGGDDQEDYYDYDDFSDQLYDLPGRLGAIYEDIKL